MPIRNRNDDSKAFKDGYDRIFGTSSKPKKNKKEKPTQGIKRCSGCNKLEEMITIEGVGWMRKYFGCGNKKCEKYRRPPEEIKNCGTHDTFSYRSGRGMSNAQDERRAAEAKSHMGGTDEIYRQIDDLNNGDYFGEVQ